MKQHVIERLAPLLGRHDKHLQIVHRRTLPREIFEARRPQDAVQVPVRSLFSFSSQIKVVLLMHHSQVSTFVHEKAPASAEAFQRRVFSSMS